MIRQSFKKFLKLLSSWAIKKHQIKTIVVSGWYGTEITREFIYAVLSNDYKIRRVLSNPTSDLSIPLAVLGYKDTKRSWFIWLVLIIRVIYQLLLGKKQKHYIVLNINFAREETVKYWASFIKPSYLVITGYKSNYAFIDGLIEKTKENKGLIIYNIKDQPLLKSVLNNYQKTSSVGINNNKATLNVL
jgi:UDP-N-acetylmuramyl pentapeptide synthase